MSKYPEHDRLKALDGANQTVGNFIEWLHEQGMEIGRFEKMRGFSDPQFVPITKSRDALLAEHFDIDRDKLEAEKRAMLDELRAAQNVA